MNTVRIICFFAMAIAQDQKLVAGRQSCENGAYFVEELGACEPCPVGKVCTNGRRSKCRAAYEPNSKLNATDC
jgi:hypothetical protein